MRQVERGSCYAALRAATCTWYSVNNTELDSLHLKTALTTAFDRNNHYTSLIKWVLDRRAGQVCGPTPPQSCQCVRRGVWRRLMKVLSCRVGLMALGSALRLQWPWEHSAIILSLSLLFVDHSQNLVCFLLSFFLSFFFPFPPRTRSFCNAALCH